nr:MAG TPA: hypothetical protein [Caudoviricetes sp.]
MGNRTLTRVIDLTNQSLSCQDNNSYLMIVIVFYICQAIISVSFRFSS